MEDFRSSDVAEILYNRFVVIIGDSKEALDYQLKHDLGIAAATDELGVTNKIHSKLLKVTHKNLKSPQITLTVESSVKVQRCIYKDLVLLLQEDRFLTQDELKKKGESTFNNDELIEGGCMESMTNGLNYREVRQYRTNVYLIRFYFVTRCYNRYVESILNDLSNSPKPDILIMNSCLWDITRYGQNSVTEYRVNLQTLFTRLSQTLPDNCLVIWNTALPISSCARGGFLVPEVEFKRSMLRLDILAANYFASKIAEQHRFDVLDLHFYLRNQLYLRVQDGVHWNMFAHRNITYLLLNHICKAWKIPRSSRRPALLRYDSVTTGCGHGQHLSGSLSSRDLTRLPQDLMFSAASGSFVSGHNTLEWQPYQQNSLFQQAPVQYRCSRYQPYYFRK